MDVLPDPISFEWDKGNIEKNLKKHSVTNQEAEEIFINEFIFLFEDEKHSSLVEKRNLIWGITKRGRTLAIIFTIRNNSIRITSARDMNKKERREYEQTIKANSGI